MKHGKIAGANAHLGVIIRHGSGYIDSVVQIIRSNRECLIGTVEIDETLIGGKRPEKRGSGAEIKAVVMVAVEYTGCGNTKGKGIGRISLKRILLPCFDLNPVGKTSLF